MPVATYGGLALFGSAATVNVAAETNARQITGYPGIHGLECLDLGRRGGTARIDGIWFFVNGLDLAATLSTWTLLCDGTPRVLIDSKGLIWPNALLDPYHLEGPSVTSAATGQVIQRFSGSLLLLST